MKYSKRLKETALRKILPPENRSISDVSREMGISEQTIYNWKKRAESSRLFLEETSSPIQTGQLEQYNIILDSKSISEDRSIATTEKYLKIEITDLKEVHERCHPREQEDW